MNSVADSPAWLTESRPVQVLSRAIAAGRLAHGLLLHGGDRGAVHEAATHLAALLLQCSPERVAAHPDLFHLRPEGKMRIIKVEPMREFIRQLMVTGSQGSRKVGFVHEADRLAKASANAFLKTLEEPPKGTTLFLLTTRPYDLLPTIRSRCVIVHLPAATAQVNDAAWLGWRQRYRQWLQETRAGRGLEAAGRAALLLSAGALAERFQTILDRLGDEAWALRKATLPVGMEDEAKEAEEVGTRKGMRLRLLAEVEEETRLAAFPAEVKAAASIAAVRPLATAIQSLERTVGLLDLNLKEEAALEYFLLSTLRAWTPRKSGES